MTLQEVKIKVEEAGYSRFYSPGLVTADFLDPKFWQALGKSLKWDGQLWCGRSGCGNKGQHFHPSSAQDWKAKWHDFITHLIEGKSIESFFEQL